MRRRRPALGAKLRPLLTAYAPGSKTARPTSRRPTWPSTRSRVSQSWNGARQTLGRIEAGLKLLLEDEKAAEAFRFANLAMWQQRIHTIVSLKRRRDEAGR